MPILNFTPNKINIYNEDRVFVKSFPSDGRVSCVATHYRFAKIDGVSLFYTEYSNITGLPEEKDDTLIIVTPVIKQALFKRLDLVIPGETMRDDFEMPIGCIGLTR